MTLLMALGWAYQQQKRNANIVDVAWSGGVGLMALVLAFTGTGAPLSRALLAGIAGVWSFRLFAHLFTTRVWKKSAEDGRYRALREKWGVHASRNFFFFFQIQAIWVVLFALPMVPAAQNDLLQFSWAHALALVIAGSAIWGEALADLQLARFKRQANSSGICQEGLWRYSRHPNYFFEWMHWWAYVALAWGSPIFWLAFLGPVLMLLFLLYVTGIPYTEKQMLAKRGQAYRDYQRTTSAFIPWFRKS